MSDSSDPVAQDAPGLQTDGGYEGGYGLLPEAPSITGHEQLRPIVRTEYRLAVRNRWALALTAIFLVFSLGLVTFSGSNVSPAGFDRTVASLAILAIYLVPLVALAFGYDAIVGEEQTGWLQVLFALPLARHLIVVGTFVGRFVVLASAIIIGFGIAGGMLLFEFGFAGFERYVGFMLATVALGGVFLAIAILISSVAREKTHALGVSLVAWAWFVLVSDLLSLGVIAAVSVPDWVVSAMILANPASVYRVLVLGGLGAGGEAGFAAILAEMTVSPGLLVVALLAWIAIPVTIGGLLVGRRRL